MGAIPTAPHGTHNASPTDNEHKASPGIPARGECDIAHRAVRKAHLVEGNTAQRKPDDDGQSKNCSPNKSAFHDCFLHFKIGL